MASTPTRIMLSTEEAAEVQELIAFARAAGYKVMDREAQARINRLVEGLQPGNSFQVSI